MHVDTEKIQLAADALGELAWTLKQAAHTLEERSESLGQPWGDDENGKKFLANYAQSHSDAVKAGTDGGAALADAAGQLNDLVAALNAIEAQAVITGQQVAIEPTNGA
ncbi:hypothetical protein [Streptomyces griseorubiginosus]|uniref:Type VII secretion system (Wss) protein ESAT-6 n=1 Tax=Streptomyces griseorubiginosus TaxID=67304 RepID=A0A101RP09_9ACTN|nr:hypothetical protein [Streptomyces griseorubiginosus]KUN59165.1 hypothetical protein AQJ54_40450 [Streptomyces griseorubiginosus]